MRSAVISAERLVLGRWIEPGQGFATQAATACLKYGFDKLQFDKIRKQLQTTSVNHTIFGQNLFTSPLRETEQEIFFRNI